MQNTAARYKNVSFNSKMVVNSCSCVFSRTKNNPISIPEEQLKSFSTFKTRKPKQMIEMQFSNNYRKCSKKYKARYVLRIDYCTWSACATIEDDQIKNEFQSILAILSFYDLELIFDG